MDGNYAEYKRVWEAAGERLLLAALTVNALQRERRKAYATETVKRAKSLLAGIEAANVLPARKAVA
jgi:hypothetical protein